MSERAPQKHIFRSQNTSAYSLNKKEWICSLFKEWILEKSEIRVNLEWTFVLFTHFGVTSGITRNPWVIPEVTPKWVNNTNVHSKFSLISLFSKIHSLKSEHIHSFLFREYIISMQFPFITDGMALYTTVVIKHYLLRKIYDYASERSERA